MDRRKSVIIVKDSDEDERCLNPPSIISTTIYLSDDDDDDDLIMDVKRKQERSVHNISPSPTKKLKSDVSSKTTQDRKMSEIAEDGEIVSSPEYDAADMEIKIHAEMTSSEDDDDQGEDMGGDGDDSTPTQDERVVSTKTADEDVEKREVIQVLDTPPEKTKDSFPQRELPVIKKRVVTTIERNDNVDVDHLEITAPAQNEVRRGKIVKKSNKDENSPKKSKVVTPEKERSSREAGDKKRPYDVYDERRIRSDSEYDEKRRVKKLEDTDDLRKHLLKRIGSEQKIRDYHERGSTSDRSKNRERSSRQRDYSSNTEERVEKSHDRDRHRESGRDSHRVIDNEKFHRQEVDRKREHREAAHHKETVHSHVSKSKHEKQRHATDSNDERRKHERHHRKERKEKSLKQDEDNNSKPTRKKKKRKHKTSDSDSSPIKPDNVQEIVPSPEKSPVAENPNKEATYDNISSGISEGEEISPDPADGGDDKSPPSERSYSRSPSEVSSRSPSRSPSLSPTPERSPTPQKKRAYFPGIEGCRNVEDFEWLNRIEEGTYGVVYRAKDKRTEEIVALKRLKMEKEREGFPITSLREINTLLKAQHPNIVTVREIVVGSNMDKIYIVMDYVEHDLKSLMSTMTQPFLVGEVKTLLLQLLRGVRHMHDNWILHRDIKASNLLLSHKGILKIGDFGLAREYGSPLKKYTSIVVTLWYRAPELLLGAKEYSTAIDMWSVGCVFAELLIMKPLFPGSSEIDQINKIFKELGTPNDKIWAGPPAYSEMPQVKKMNIAEHPYNQLRNRFGATFTDRGLQLLNSMLTYDPARRITADEALRHPYFQEAPKPVDPSMFPTWPAKSELGHKALKKNASPKPPEGGQFGKMGDDGMGGFHMLTTNKGSSAKSSGFSLKF